MSKEFDDWRVVKSQNGYTKDGVPCGDLLCKDKKCVQQVCENIDCPIVSDYYDKSN